jgi:hypothetical protein
MARSPDVKTPLARLAFTQHLFKPQERDSGKKQYNCTLLFPKTADLSGLEKAVLDAAVEEWGDKAKELAKNGLIKNPFLDGDGPQGVSKKKGERYAGFAGHRFIRAMSGEDFRPKLVNRKVLPITSQDECYSGCYGYAVVHAFTWENKENGKGVSFGLSMIQVAKDGERLGGLGGGEPEEHFEKLEDEGEAPAATKAGAGAGGLFS